MGQLVRGVWKDEWYDTDAHGGEFMRDTARFRNWVTADGTPGPTGGGGFAAESGRYHLYVSYACPWAHRTLIFRAIKGLEDHIGVSVVHPDMLQDGWSFDDSFPGATGDQLFDSQFMRDIYLRADPQASGRVTVPVLWDRERDTIVSNESADIIRMLNSAFDGISGNDDDYYPESLRPRIDELNDRIYDSVNNGVYKAGFATSQQAYDRAAGPLFDSLDWIEGLLAEHRYLAGSRLTEADWRLFTTICRFDAVYHTHFKCNRKRIVDYPNLWGWARELYQWPGIAQTVRPDHFIRHYYFSHATINPHRILPIGPAEDWTTDHGRG
ncbi:glutathione S-transferase family protein [Paracoccus seriniphilus]|uniref:Putative glutathione S-transferase n=1 Tax=Paracoccus seriniphilus TaxID=184748 RepID=A0A239Q1Y8_9RHOB|nr:glutathione S-transferase family protein [Paracoccus seriniphilus]WCR13951.1 glutathione S-transferase family protein [Paracoccus seriniphilus]SNT75967.1 putative glutathione S-transferase [Paracoccus seriniphilus]